MTRSLEMRAEFAGEEFPVSVDCSPDVVRLRNGGEVGHGEVMFSWEDFDKVLAEVAWYRRAKSTTDFGDAERAA